MVKLGFDNCQPREFPTSGSKAKDIKEKERERPKVGNNNGQLCIANATSVAHAKPPGPKPDKMIKMNNIVLVLTE